MFYDEGNETIQVGSYKLTRLSDGQMISTAEMLATNGPADEVAAALKIEEHGQPRLRVTCLLIQTGDQNILVDTGWGRWDFSARRPDGEPVTAHLAKLGLSTDDIDLVVHTHTHPDHVGGNCVETDGDLRPRYQRARYRAHVDDWNYYTAPERLEDPERGEIFKKNLPPLEQHGVIDLFDSEIDVAPGVRMLPTPGHSPGHCSIVITSGNEMVLYLGDVAHHPIHLEHPEWNAVFDVFPEQARETRRWLYDRLVRDKPWIIGCHFVTPGVGVLEKVAGRYKWKTETGERRVSS